MTDLFLSPVGDDWINKLTEKQIRVLLERGEINPERVAEHVSKQTRMYRDQYIDQSDEMKTGIRSSHLEIYSH